MHKSQKITQITSAIIAHANSVAVQHDQYVSQFVTRGRQELYMLLSDIYAVLLSVNASKQSKQILNEMRASIQTAAVNAGMRAHVPKSHQQLLLCDTSHVPNLKPLAFTSGCSKVPLHKAFLLPIYLAT